MDSPSQSPETLLYPFLLGHSCESNSDCSSPGSCDDFKPMLYTNISSAYVTLPLDIPPASRLAATAGRKPLEYIGPSIIGDGNQRHRKSNLAKRQENITNMTLRRRAQNRASQRAFRERKEKHVQDLENQLQDLQGKYQVLLQSYTHQAVEVQRLNQQIRELTSELERPRASNDMSLSCVLMQEHFDTTPYPALTNSDPEYYLIEGAMKLNAKLSFSVADNSS